jgi:hypothetical protein
MKSAQVAFGLFTAVHDGGRRACATSRTRAPSGAARSADSSLGDTRAARQAGPALARSDAGEEQRHGPEQGGSATLTP